MIVGTTIENNLKQETQGPWHSARRFANWNQHSIMDKVNVAEVTYQQSAISVF